MNKSILTTLVAAAAVVTASTGALQAQAPSATQEGGFYKPFVEIGPSLYQLNMSADWADWGKFDSMTHYGFSVGGGFYSFPSSVGTLRTQFELGFYTHSHSVSDSNPDWGWSEKLDVDSLAVPILATIAYEFNIPYVEQLKVRAGLTLGFLVWGADAKYTYVDPSEFYSGKDDTVSTVLTFGVNLGVSYQFTENFHADLSYRFSGNGEIEVFADEEKASSTAHQLSLSVGYRF
jgi:opacity protein-like surface antigen